MAVAWIGNRETQVERAAAHAAQLLASSRCPVFSFDTDIHGTRAAIALAESVGGVYDHVDSAALARETALFTDRGGMVVAPGETRRRADLVAIVGELPAAHYGFIAELAATVPDLSPTAARQFFLVDGKAGASALPDFVKPTRLYCGTAGPGATLASLRAQLAGRQVAARATNFSRFAEALAVSRFPVFLFSGQGVDSLAMEMLQGLIGDLGRKGRASALHLPASENGWGSVLASTWMTGFPPRTGFGRGVSEFDPWRFDVARMLKAGEADLHVCISHREGSPPRRSNGTKLLALMKTNKPVRGAAVTIAIGVAGIDHDAVIYSARVGTLKSVQAAAPSEVPSAAVVVRMIAGHLDGAPLPC